MNEHFLFFDGGIVFNSDRKTGKIAYAYILFDFNRNIISSSCLIEDNGTTPKAEYKALILGLEELKNKGLDEVFIFGDSQLIVNQILGKYRCDSPELKDLFSKAKALMNNNLIRWIPREENTFADKLTKEALNPFRSKLCNT